MLISYTKMINFLIYMLSLRHEAFKQIFVIIFCEATLSEKVNFIEGFEVTMFFVFYFSCKTTVRTDMLRIIDSRKLIVEIWNRLIVSIFNLLDLHYV